MATIMNRDAPAFVGDMTGHNFEDNNLLIEALDTTAHRIQFSNQRLAMLGDALLKHVILDDWYSSGEGQNLVDNIGSNPRLARVGRKNGLDNYIIINAGQMHQRQVSDKIIATTLEALLGAIYLDGGRCLGLVKLAMIKLGLVA